MDVQKCCLQSLCICRSNSNISHSSRPPAIRGGLSGLDVFAITICCRITLDGGLLILHVFIEDSQSLVDLLLEFGVVINPVVRQPPLRHHVGDQLPLDLQGDQLGIVHL